MAKTLLVVYYSKTGTTKQMAAEVARGAEDSGVFVNSKTFEDCTISDLLNADGLAFGSPTHYCNMAWQPKRFLDELVLDFYSKGHTLKDRVCGCFTSTGTYEDGKECLRMLELAFSAALKMQLVPGVVMETNSLVNGHASECYELGQKIAQQLALQK